MSKTLDIVLINPACRKRVYQSLGNSLAAVEKRQGWCLTPAERIIAADMLRRGKSAEAVAAELRQFGQ